MKLLSWLAELPSSLCALMARHYRPELHYMRGPGPAYQRRKVAREEARLARQFADVSNIR